MLLNRCLNTFLKGLFSNEPEIRTMMYIYRVSFSATL